MTNTTTATKIETAAAALITVICETFSAARTREQYVGGVSVVDAWVESNVRGAQAACGIVWSAAVEMDAEAVEMYRRAQREVVANAENEAREMMAGMLGVELPANLF